mgnify:CR=1 FL=1
MKRSLLVFSLALMFFSCFLALESSCGFRGVPFVDENMSSEGGLPKENSEKENTDQAGGGE